MTLIELSIYIGIFALVLTAIEYKVVKNYIYSFLQNFVGAFFVVSGAVKIVDPLGTAFKMEDYFEQFYMTFNETAFSFIAPLFPFLSEYSATFAVVVIVFEIVLGIMMLIGLKPKLTSWLYIVLVIFFTFLTGFTYLTGYVPTSANFFDFSEWQPYQASNMRVTDCGCFGDFILLDPGVSFTKDIILLIPGLIFIFFSKYAHKLFTEPVRWGITVAVIVLTTIYGLSNYVWNIPDFDFRPFNEGQDVRQKKIDEEEAMANVKIEAFRVRNTQTDEITDVPYQDYMNNYSALYGTDEYETLDQIKTAPSIEPTKISDFSFYDDQGFDMSGDFLAESGYTFMIISYKLLGEVNYIETEVADTSYVTDTVAIVGEDMPLDTSYQLVQKVDTIITVLKEVPDVDLDEAYRKAFAEKLNPILNKARDEGYNSIGLLGGMSNGVMNNLMEKTSGAYKVYEADDITLKTMIRSNPGLILWHDGKIVKKWHYKKVPTYSEILETYVK